MSGAEHMFKMFRLVRLFKLSYLAEFTSRLIDPIKFRLITFILWVWHIAHWTACGWIMIDGVEKTDFLGTYIKAIYWSTTTITTVGYGDITPQNDTQMLYAMLVMFLGIALYAYVIGNIATVLANLNLAKNRHNTKIEEINSYLRYHKVPKETTKKINDYLQYVWNHRLIQYQSLILQDLPQSLRKEIALHINHEFLNKVSIFNNADPKLLEEIVLEFKPIVFHPFDWVYHAGDEARSMYFINSGEVTIFGKNGERIATIGEGSHFGEMALLSDKIRSASIQTNTYCELHVLKKEHFLEKLEKYPNFKKILHEFTEKRMSNKN
jgi:hypothetical protein